MTAKTRKSKKIHNKTSKKVSKRVLEMWKDPTTVWGKNKPLEKNTTLFLYYPNGYRV
jgi:hypothetical protein